MEQLIISLLSGAAGGNIAARFDERQESWHLMEQRCRYFGRRARWYCFECYRLAGRLRHRRQHRFFRRWWRHPAVHRQPFQEVIYHLLAVKAKARPWLRFCFLTPF